MSKPCWPQSVLAEQMSLPSTAQHVFGWHTQIIDLNLAMVVPTGHGLNVANDIPTFTWYVHDEARVGGLRHVGIFLCAGNQ